MYLYLQTHTYFIFILDIPILNIVNLPKFIRE